MIIARDAVAPWVRRLIGVVRKYRPDVVNYPAAPTSSEPT
jgi:hypothetical protein